MKEFLSIAKQLVDLTKNDSFANHFTESAERISKYWIGRLINEEETLTLQRTNRNRETTLHLLHPCGWFFDEEGNEKNHLLQSASFSFFIHQTQLPSSISPCELRQNLQICSRASSTSIGLISRISEA